MHDLRQVRQYLMDEAAVLAADAQSTGLLQLFFQKYIQFQHEQTAVYSKYTPEDCHKLQ